jgi:hypothetical protein
MYKWCITTLIVPSLLTLTLTSYNVRAGGTVDLNGSSSLEGGILAERAIKSNGTLELKKVGKVLNPDLPGFKPVINNTPSSMTGVLKAGGMVVGPDGVTVSAPANWTGQPVEISIERVDMDTLNPKIDKRYPVVTGTYRIIPKEDIESKVPIEINLPLPRRFRIYPVVYTLYPLPSSLDELFSESEYIPAWSALYAFEQIGGNIKMHANNLKQGYPLAFVAMASSKKMPITDLQKINSRLIVVPTPSYNDFLDAYKPDSFSKTLEGNQNINSAADLANKFPQGSTVWVKGNLSINPKLSLENVTVFVEGNLNLNGGMNLGKTVILAQQIEVNGSEGKLEDSVLIAAKGLNLNTALDSSNQSTLFAAENLSLNGKIKANEQLALIATGNIKLNSKTQEEIKAVMWSGGTVALNGSSSLEGGILAGGAIRSNGSLELEKVGKVLNQDVTGYTPEINTTPASSTGTVTPGGIYIGLDGVKIFLDSKAPESLEFTIERINPAKLVFRHPLPGDTSDIFDIFPPISTIYRVKLTRWGTRAVDFKAYIPLKLRKSNNIDSVGFYSNGKVDFAEPGYSNDFSNGYVIFNGYTGTEGIINLGLTFFLYKPAQYDDIGITAKKTTRVYLNGSSSLEGEILAGGAIRSNGSLELKKMGKVLNQDVTGYTPEINTTPASSTGTLVPGGTYVGLDGVKIVSPTEAFKPFDITIERVDPSSIGITPFEKFIFTSNFYRITSSRLINNRYNFKIFLPLLLCVKSKSIMPFTFSYVSEAIASAHGRLSGYNWNAFGGDFEVDGKSILLYSNLFDNENAPILTSYLYIRM